MLFKMYKSSTLQGTRTDISDYVTAISNLTWKRKIDYGYVLPHPTITIKPNLTVEKGDYIHIEIDDDIKLCTYIDKIEEPTGGKSKVLKCWDLLKKLEDTYIKDLDLRSIWWSSDSWWSALSAAEKEELFQYTGDQHLDYYKQYITVGFLIQVMMKRACGFDFKSAQTNDIIGQDSEFTKMINMGGSSGDPREDIKYNQIVFQLFQLDAIGSENYEDDASEGATLLTVFNSIVKMLKIKFTYETVSGNVQFVLKTYSTPTIPSSDNDGYSTKELQLYDGVIVKLKTLLQLSYYYSEGYDWESGEKVENKPNIPSHNEKYNKIEMMKHFEVLFIQEIEGLNQVFRLGYIDSDFTYIKQYAEVLEDLYTTEWEEKTFMMHFQEERDALEISYDFKKCNAKIIYLDEVASDK